MRSLPGSGTKDGNVPIIERGDCHIDLAVGLWERAELTRLWNAPEEHFRRGLQRPSSTLVGLVEETCSPVRSRWDTTATEDGSITWPSTQRIRGFPAVGD